MSPLSLKYPNLQQKLHGYGEKTWDLLRYVGTIVNLHSDLILCYFLFFSNGEEITTKSTQYSITKDGGVRTLYIKNVSSEDEFTAVCSNVKTTTKIKFEGKMR